MPSIDENLHAWAERSVWHDGGDEWSAAWGGAEPQWFGCVLPRLHRLLPAGTILELGPGYGRWTQFLLQHCDRFVGIDLAEGCVEACRERFADRPNVGFHQNDGRSLAEVDDRSIDFAFSFDSLVHAEADVLDDYLLGLSSKLTEEGTAFLHHSNLGELRRRFDFYDRIPVRLRGAMERTDLIDRSHWRARSVSASSFVTACERAGLRCVGQEIVNWGSRKLIDCISLVARPSHPLAARPMRRVRNPRFMAEAASIRAASGAWGALGES